MKNSDIIKAFNHFKKDPRLHTDVLWGGCAERTKIMCENLNQKELQAGFVCLPKEGWSDEELSCRAKLTNEKIEEFLWTRHFVPCVFDEQKNIVVLDICLMDGPEYLSLWKKHILFRGTPIEGNNYSLNHPGNMEAINVHLKGIDPLVRLQSTAQEFPKRLIKPNQVKSQWLQEQQLKYKKFFKAKQNDNRTNF